MGRRISRRALLGGGITAAAGGVVAALLGRDEPVSLPAVPAGLPVRQHAWNDRLPTDEHGNVLAPKFHKLLLFDVDGDPSPRHVRKLEACLRRLDATVPMNPDGGALLLVGWGPGYLADHTDGSYELPRPEPLSGFETPTLDDHDVCMHVASNDEQQLADIEAALIDGHGPLAESVPSLDGALVHRETRTGFTGKGIPAARQDVGGIPPDGPVPKESPLFMGFTSGFRRNQATEDDVTIDAPPLVGATTMHVSRLRLRLDSWYELLDDDQRAARMFAPQTDANAARAVTNEADPHADELQASARDRGVVGHLQASAGARRNGRPVILRRDFNTTDGGQAGLHFVALQGDISDFVATRRAMNASDAPYANPAIGARSNNGIKEFMFITHRANYLVPPRPQRSFPLWPGREGALT